MTGRRRRHPFDKGAAIDISYRIAGHEGIVGPGHPLWPAPLPTLRPTASSPTGGNAEPRGVTHADYFQAVRAYVTGPGRTHIQQALAARRAEREPGPGPDRITVILEKHGEFYHPSRLDVAAQGTLISLALNVAVTPAGEAWMASEIDALRHVAPRLPAGCLPVVYGKAAIPRNGVPPVPMFLADWFDDYHEFHLTIDPRTGRQRMVVWDTARGPFFLSDRQRGRVHRKAAYLLTRAYDPVTSRQIYPWHHASGDFVLRIADGSIDLRLITVRQYASTLEGQDGGLDDEARLTALLVFFLNLTLRNRLDRLDGTGEPAWAETPAAASTVAGVFDALDPPWGGALQALLRTYGVGELMEVLAVVAARYRLMAREEEVLSANLAPHAEQLHDALRRMPRGR